MIDKSREIKIIQQQLMIPVSDVQFQDAYVDVYSDGRKIGGLPYYHLNMIITYDTAEGILKWLKWEWVYEKYKQDFNDKVINLIKKEIEQITLGTFRYLYVKSRDGKNYYVQCAYKEGEGWTLHVEKEY